VSGTGWDSELETEREMEQGVGKVGGWWRLGRFDGALTGWCVVEMGARAP